MKLIIEEIEDVEFICEASNNGKKSFYIQGPFLQADVKNRNGRIYESRILDPAVKTYIENFVDKNRAMGELSHPCFSPSAEILTTSGWKLMKDIDEREEIYTTNLNSNSVEIQSIDKKVINYHNGKMLHIYGRSIDTLVTPDHRFLIQDRNGKYEFITAQDIFDSSIGKGRTLSHHMIPKCLPACEKESLDYFVIPPYIKNLKRQSFIEKYEHPIEIESKAFSFFFGVYLAEGGVRHNIQKDTYATNISQNSGAKCDEIRHILQDTNLEWNESIRINSVGNEHVVFSCYDRRLGYYLKSCGNIKSKKIPLDFINGLNDETARAFLDGYILGDGRGKLQKRSGRCDSFSISKEMVNNISHIAAIAGIGTRNYTEITKKDYIFADRVIQAKNKNPLHFCRFLNTKGTYIDFRFLKIEEVDYDGNVYCVQVENSNFLARDNGFSFMSGNCGPAINLDRVSHKVTSLHKEGSNWIGKAKILDTPMGRIASALLNDGIQLGVSSRGMGSLIERNGGKYVGDDFMLSTVADIVSDPSAPAAFVNGIMEGVEWYYDTTGKLMSAESAKREIESSVDSKDFNEEKMLEIFESYLRNI